MFVHHIDQCLPFYLCSSAGLDGLDLLVFGGGDHGGDEVALAFDDCWTVGEGGRC